MKEASCSVGTLITGRDIEDVALKWLGKVSWQTLHGLSWPGCGKLPHLGVTMATTKCACVDIGMGVVGAGLKFDEWCEMVVIS